MSIDRVIGLYADYHWEGELRAANRLADGIREGVIVSIGSYRGQMDCALALHAHVPVFCIDPRVSPGTHYGDVDRSYWMRNVLDIGVADKVRPIELPSLTVAPIWTEPIGLLFIDGDHFQAGADLTAWMPYVMDGGLVAMHDTNRAEVIQAVAGRDDLVEIERSNLLACYRKEPLYEPYTYEGQTLLVRKGIAFGDDKSTLGEVRTYEVGPEPVRTCIDIGANIGAFTAWIKHAWPGAKVVAVEPELSSLKVLYRNVNDLRGVEVLYSAVRYSQEASVLYVNPNNSGCHKVLLLDEVPDGMPITPLPSTVTLEQIVAIRKWQGLDLLKLDCEGSEVDILLNCSEAFLHSVRRIVGEFHYGYANFMAGIGARLQGLDFDVTGTQDPLAHATFVAINKNWVETVGKMTYPDLHTETQTDSFPMAKKKAGRPKKT